MKKNLVQLLFSIVMPWVFGYHTYSQVPIPIVSGKKYTLKKFSPSFCFSKKMSKECVAEENEKNIIKVLCGNLVSVALHLCSKQKITDIQTWVK